MATHSSVLAWRIQWTEELLGCRLWGRTESDTTEATYQQQQQQDKQMLNVKQRRKEKEGTICWPKRGLLLCSHSPSELLPRRLAFPLHPGPAHHGRVSGCRVSGLGAPPCVRFRNYTCQRLPRWLSGRKSPWQCRRCRFDSWIGKIPWRRKWQPTPVFLPGESQGQKACGL